jgi:hypothetical protein
MPQSSKPMNSRLDSTNLNPHRTARLRTLVGLLAKSRLVQSAAVRVVHDYSHYKWGRDYVFESLEGSKQGYLKGYGGNIQRGDHLILRNGLETIRYQVDEIEHYVDPPNLWIALLRSCAGPVCDRRFWMGPVEPCCEPALNYDFSKPTPNQPCKI